MDRPAFSYTHAWPALQELEVAMTTISVSDLQVMADIGINADEIGVPQPLILNVVLRLLPTSGDRIDQTVDYCAIVAHAERLAACRTGLIETFARQLAEACLTNPLVLSADIQVSKPKALPNGLAGTRLLLRRPAS